MATGSSPLHGPFMLAQASAVLALRDATPVTENPGISLGVMKLALGRLVDLATDTTWPENRKQLLRDLLILAAQAQVLAENLGLVREYVHQGPNLQPGAPPLPFVEGYSDG